jgi:hypothetical protein
MLHKTSQVSYRCPVHAIIESFSHAEVLIKESLTTPEIVKNNKFLICLIFICSFLRALSISAKEERAGEHASTNKLFVTLSLLRNANALICAKSEAYWWTHTRMFASVSLSPCGRV